MVACSGAGKTYYSKDFCEKKNIIRLSSDELRAVIGKDESDQSVSGKVFNFIESATEYFVKSGRDVLIDATNLRISARGKYVRIAQKCGVPITAIVIKKTLAELEEGNSNRPRSVPHFVIENQLNNFVLPTVLEGFVEIIYV